MATATTVGSVSMADHDGKLGKGASPLAENSYILNGAALDGQSNSNGIQTNSAQRGSSPSVITPNSTASLVASKPTMDLLSASSQPNPARFSSPLPASSVVHASQAAQQLPATSLRHRHTLQVPKAHGSRNSAPGSSMSDAVTSGRFSPTTAVAPRRASVSLGRRATRSVHSDLHIEEIPQDEDAARWAEAIKAKRASKRRRQEEEEDDKVVVGTKVDHNHVNWVTAYNMLTGIRFVVSRVNAKMDRPLTDADFVAKHKFSFDMWVTTLRK